MLTTSENLLVKFRSRDTPFGVTRATIKALAKELDINEAQVIQMALSRFAHYIFQPMYQTIDH